MPAVAADRNPGLSAPDVDDAMRRLAADADRMADALGALENHPGRLFLDSALLAGATAPAWAAAKTSIALLYQRFDAYRDVLARAREVRERRQKPGPADLAELAELLTGPAVELSSEDIPLERRNLTGPATLTHRRSLTELVAEMDAAFGDVTELVVAVDEVRSAAVRTLDPFEQRLHTARKLAASLGLDAANHPLFTSIDVLGKDLAAIQELAFADPLALHAGPLGAGSGGHPDLSHAHRLDDDLARVRAELDALVRVRAEFADRLADARVAVDRVIAEAARARTARETVLAKIAAPAIGSVPDAAAALRERLRRITELSMRGDWPEVSSELAGLERAAAAALTDVRAVRDTADALLARRAELRGRLDAYNVKAARMRLSEDPELAESYQNAHDLLWRSPCDLRSATRALVRYQQLIADRGPAR
jgi:hypothetical protein